MSVTLSCQGDAQHDGIDQSDVLGDGHAALGTTIIQTEITFGPSEVGGLDQQKPITTRLRPCYVYA
jgi:hypothetical protein